MRSITYSACKRNKTWVLGQTSRASWSEEQLACYVTWIGGLIRTFPNDPCPRTLRSSNWEGSARSCPSLTTSFSSYSCSKLPPELPDLSSCNKKKQFINWWKFAGNGKFMVPTGRSRYLFGWTSSVQRWSCMYLLLLKMQWKCKPRRFDFEFWQ